MGLVNKDHSDFIEMCFVLFLRVFLKVMTYKCKTQSLTEFYNLHLKDRKISHILAIREIHYRFGCHRIISIIW